MDVRPVVFSPDFLNPSFLDWICTLCYVWLQLTVILPSTDYTPVFPVFSKCFRSRQSWFCFILQTVLTCAGSVRELRAYSWEGRGLWVIFWDCCSVPEASPERRWGWRSAGSWLCWLRLPSSSGSPPLSAAASPAWKTSHSLCRGAPLCGYCLVLQGSKPQGEKGMKDRTTENISFFKYDNIWPGYRTQTFQITGWPG